MKCRRIPKTHPVSVALDAPGGGTEAGVAACFHNRTQLVVPDASRSPFASADESGRPPARSLLFVPMFVQGEVIGVIEIGRDKGSRDVHRGRADAGAAPGQPDRPGHPTRRAALRARTAFPHRKTGGRRDG